MKKILNIISLLLILFTVGCYEDKGNYDYTNLPMPIISGIMPMYETFIGDELAISPTIDYEKGNITNPKYKWYIDKKLVSEERNLKFVINMKPGITSYASYGVVDGDTGVETYYKFKIKTESNFKQGWVILSDDGSKGVLSYQRPDGVFYNNIYEDINSEALSSQPVKLREHFLPWSSETGQINVICKGGPNQSVELDGSSFSKVLYNRQEFVNNSVPHNFKPIDAYYVSEYDYLFNDDGKIFVRQIDPNIGWEVKYQTGRFPDFTFYGDYELTDWLTRGNILFSNDIISYDKKNRRYVVIAKGSIVSFNTNNDKIKAFEVINMDKTVIAGGPVSIGNAPKDYYATILKGDDGQFYVQQFYMSGWGSPKSFYSTKEDVFPKPELIKSDSKFVVCIGRPYIYISSGSQLWQYNYESNDHPVMIKDYGKKITAMASDLTFLKLGLGLEGGDFLTVDVSIVGQGNIVTEQRGACANNIVDVLWKIGDQWEINNLN